MIIKDLKYNFINNEWIGNRDSNPFEITDKFTKQVLTKIPSATKEETNLAITSSLKAFNDLKKWSAGIKSQMLYKLKNELEKERVFFVDLIVKESGKPKSYAENEIERCLITLDTAGKEALTFKGEIVPIDYSSGEGKTAITKRYPLGPIVCISPFNFPLNLALHKIAPALACGCSVVLKPSPYSPLSTLAFASLVKKVGYPAGSVNVLLCDNQLAEEMVRDERFKMLSFTGSPKIGWYLKSIAGKKKVTLELGGNAATIVDESADIEKAAKLCSIGSFLYSGQICISTQRIYVHQKVYDQFRNKLIENTNSLKIGNPEENDTILGPIIDQVHLDRINDWVKEAKENGAEVLTGGQIFSKENSLYSPTILTNTNTNMKVVSEEVFGPVVVLEKVGSFEEGIEKSNNTKFGLQVGVFTNQINHLKMAMDDLDVAGIMINNIPGYRIDNMPYGGIKDSGFGREGIRYAMEEMTESKLIIY